MIEQMATSKMESYLTIEAYQLVLRTTWMNLKGIMVSETSQCPNDSVYVTEFLELQNYRDGEQINCCHGLKKHRDSCRIELW